MTETKHEHCRDHAPGNGHNVVLDDDTVMDLSDFFKIFGDSTRIRILWALHGGEMCVQCISDTVDMSLSAVSHQLRYLKEAHLVKSRREGKQIYYALCDHHIMEILDTALEHIEEGRE